MSLRAPSVIGLVGALQRQGLTYAMLKEWVECCERQHTGPVMFHMTQGRIRCVQAEARSSRKPKLAHD